MTGMSNASKRKPDVQGDFTRYPLPRLLFYLLKKKFTGQLICRPPEIDPGRVYFRDGKPVFTDLKFSQDYLGTILLQRNLINQTAYDESLQKLADGKELHGQILIKQEALDQPKLVKGLRKQLYRKLIRLFPVTTTTFALYSGEHKRGKDNEEAKLSADPLWLIYHGIRNGFPREVMTQELVKLQGKSIRLKPEFAPQKKRYGLGQEEEGLLTLLEHSAADLSEVIRISNMGPLETEMLVYTLWTSEVLIVTKPEEKPAAQQAPMAPPPLAPPLEAEGTGQIVSAPPSRVAGAEAGPLSRVLTPPPPDDPDAMNGVPPLTAMEKKMLEREGISTGGAGKAPKAPQPAGPSATEPPVDEDAPLPFEMSESPAKSAFSQESQAASEHRRIVKEAFETIQEQDHYDVLGVQRDAPANVVRDAYYKLAKQFHPDRCNQLGIRDVAPQSDEIFRRISEAHTVLSDPDEAKKYVEQLEGKTSKQEALSALEAEFVFQKGIFFFRKKDYKSARDHFQEAYRLNSKEGEHLAWMAWTDYNDPHTKNSVEVRQRVLEQLEEAREISPRNSQIFYFLGEYFAAQAKDKEAIKYFNECLEVKPDHMEAERHLRVIRMRLDKRKAAEIKASRGLFGLFGRKKDDDDDKKKKKKKKKKRW